MGIRLLIFVPWVIYLIGIALSLLHVQNQPLVVFGLISALGAVAGVLAIRNLRRWRTLAVIASVAFLSLSLLRYIGFLSVFLTDYPSISAALNQYLVEARFAISGAIDRKAFVALFMYPYHEWVMPAIQVVVVALISREWLSLRSDSALHTDAARR